jgi:hypothetical protein
MVGYAVCFDSVPAETQTFTKQNESGMDDNDVQAPQKLGQWMINQCRAKHKLTKEQIAALKVFQDRCGSRHQKQSM